MYEYLLPGSEFHDALRDHVSTIDDTLMYASFDYTNNVSSRVEGLEAIPVASDKSDSIVACISEDGTHLYVHSNHEIRLLDCQMMFYRMNLLCRVYLNNFNTDECDTMRRMFMGCSSLHEVDMSNLSSRNVEDFTEMFSGCSSLTSIDIQRFRVPSTKETCVFSDMFKNTPSLRRLTVGSTFTFAVSMGIANPDPSVINQSDGKWHLASTGQSFDASELSGGVDGTYYACDVTSTEHDSDLVTVAGVRGLSKEIANQVAKKLKYLNVQ